MIQIHDLTPHRFGKTEQMIQAAFAATLTRGPSLIVTNRPAQIIEVYRDLAEEKGLVLREMVNGVAIERKPTIACTQTCSTCAAPPDKPCPNTVTRERGKSQ